MAGTRTLDLSVLDHWEVEMACARLRPHPNANYMSSICNTWNPKSGVGNLYEGALTGIVTVVAANDAVGVEYMPYISRRGSRIHF
jgi:hypothetical protein